MAERRLTTVIYFLSTIVVGRAFLRDEGLSQAKGEYPKPTISFPVCLFLAEAKNVALFLCFWTT